MPPRPARHLVAIAAMWLSAELCLAAPSVASLNLCADQLVLGLADPEQILSLSWLARDPAESLHAPVAIRYPFNYGSAEEIVRLDPDVIVAGIYTSAATRGLLKRLGYQVVELAPAETIAAIAANVLEVASAIGQEARGQRRVAVLQQRLAELAHTRLQPPLAAVVLRPGRFTVGHDSLAHELMTHAGLINAAALHGLDRWGSLSLESLLAIAPPLIILDEYRPDEASLANAALDHPALNDYLARATVVRTPGSAWSCGLPESVEMIALLQDAARSARP